jgi:polyhydroxybutyrate depolymerase
MMFMQFALAGILALVLPVGAAVACGAKTDCPVANGTYRINLPEGKPVGALVFAHGYQGSAAGIMKNTSLLKMASDRGLALIALQALDDDWDIPNAPGNQKPARDELDYVDSVVADAVRVFDIPRDNVVISGFSAGGMLVWNVICGRGDAYAGYIPYSGTFWKGPPATCPAPAQNIVHVHGTADRTVPMAGRAIADTRQGNVMDVLKMYKDAKGMSDQGSYRVADLTCTRSVSDTGKRLDLCLFDGDHSFTTSRIAAAYDSLMNPDNAVPNP